YTHYYDLHTAVTSPTLPPRASPSSLLFFHAPTPPDIYTLSLHDALPICIGLQSGRSPGSITRSCVSTSASAVGESLAKASMSMRSEEHTSELQSPDHLVCRLLLEKKKTTTGVGWPVVDDIQGGRVVGI